MEIRIKGGTTCGNMRTLIKAIMDRLLSKDTDIDTEEEAFDLLPGILRRLRARYASDPKVEDEGKEEEVEDEEEDTDDDDDTDYSVYVDACYKTYKALIEQCDKKSRQGINKLVAKLRSLYKGSAKTGLMKTLASELFGIGGLDSDCKTEQITAKLDGLKSSMEEEGGASDDILVAFTKLLKYAPEVVNDLISLAEKLRNMYLGSILGVETSRLMRSLATSIFGSLGETCNDDDVVTELKRLKLLHDDVSQETDESEDESSSDDKQSNSSASSDNDSSSSGESDGSSPEEAFAALVGHAPQYADPNCFASLATKLRSMFMGSKTIGLMQTLASNIFGNLGEDCTDDDVVTELKRLKSDGSSSEEAAFAALVEHVPQYADVSSFASLATKLRSTFMGSKTSGLMHTFARAMLDQFGADGLGDTILDKLESLHQQYKSSLNNDDSDSDSHHSSSEFDDTVYEAYLALITHKPSISEDFSSLASLISYYSLNDEATFKQNLKQLKKYIQDNFKPNGRFANSNVKFVYSRKADGSRDSLYNWWSAVIGYATYLRFAPIYKKASGEQLTKLREILGNNFDDYEAIDAVIEAAKSQKHEKIDTAATKKKRGKRMLGSVFGPK